MKRWTLTEQPFTDGLTQAVFEHLSAKGDRSTLTGYGPMPSFARTDLAEALDDLAQAAGEAARELRGEGDKLHRQLLDSAYDGLKAENERLRGELRKATETFATLCNDVSGSSASALEERACLVDGWNTERELHDATRVRLEAAEERIATIADEAFGPLPVQSVEENLSAIERGIFEARTGKATT